MELDLRSVTPSEQSRHLLARFEELSPGEHLDVLATDAASDTLAALQDMYSGQFEWWPLVEGPDDWRILVLRRDQYSPRERRVLEFMDRDHQRLFGLLGEAVEALEAGRHGESRRLIRYFGTGLRKHARMEEEVLLPVVAEKLVSPRGPAMLLRAQHVALSDEQDLLEADCSLTEEDPEPGTALERLRPRLEALVSLLRDHVATEERTLYPVVDYLLDARERDAVVKRCQAMI